MERGELDTILDKFGVQDIIFDLVNSLSAVKGLSELDSSVKNEKDLVIQALNVLIDNQDMERCSFYMSEDEEYLVNLTGLSSDEHITGEKLTDYQPTQFAFGEGIIGLAAKTGQMQLCNDCEDDPRFQKNKNSSSNFLPGSLISVPVVAENKLLGVLNISHPEANYFTDWHIRLLDIYKNMLGQLITNCRLFQKQENKIANRTNELQKALENAQQLREHFENQAMIDDLTGLFNRRYFYIQAEMAVANTVRHGQVLCLLVIDIDFFKKLNDTYGHQCGDQVLIHVSELLKQQMRDTDILVRFGGEEFVVIFTNTDCQNGKIFAERIRETIELSIYKFQEHSISTTVSIGVYCLDQDIAKQKSIKVDEIINRADLALYEAKETGRNKVTLFNKSLLPQKISN